jgi:hypothetical protein
MKDSGQRITFESGMIREPEDGRPRFDLMIPEGIPYDQQMLTRFAVQMALGAEKYAARNWERGLGEAELARYRSGAFRHFMQWFCGEEDEDHAAALFFNITCAETAKYRLAN